jgi:hypothetical protein
VETLGEAAFLLEGRRLGRQLPVEEVAAEIEE